MDGKYLLPLLPFTSYPARCGHYLRAQKQSKKKLLKFVELTLINFFCAVGCMTTEKNH